MENRYITVGGQVIEYKLKRMRSVRNIRMRVDGQGNVAVTVGMSCSIADIERFIINNGSWLTNTLRRVESVSIKFADGDIVYYCGKAYRLQLSHMPPYGVSFDKDIALVSFPDGQSARDVLRRYYEERSAERLISVFERTLSECSTVCAKSADIQCICKSPVTVSVKTAVSYLGKCQPAKRHIVLSSILMSYDDEVVRAVVYHELTHLVEANHQANFYRVLNALMPEYASVTRRRKADRNIAMFNRYLLAKN